MCRSRKVVVSRGYQSSFFSDSSSREKLREVQIITYDINSGGVCPSVCWRYLESGVGTCDIPDVQPAHGTPPLTIDADDLAELKVTVRGFDLNAWFWFLPLEGKSVVTCQTKTSSSWLWLVMESSVSRPRVSKCWVSDLIDPDKVACSTWK